MLVGQKKTSTVPAAMLHDFLQVSITVTKVEVAVVVVGGGVMVVGTVMVPMLVLISVV